MKALLTTVFIFICTLQMQAQEPTNGRPRIGLALSGGGAKGLAHIGILKAIDSAGLNVDYITGTSMGAIMGALYAVGYSGKQIETIAQKINWDHLLGNQLSLKSLSIQEKDEYGRYAVELPYINNKLQLPGGLLEGQELWFKFAQLFYPVRHINDFSRFSIPFKCIAANIATGEAVVLDRGNITTAIRASMAIPSVFTSVDINGQKLVDGGVVRNFPVKDVISMGADYVIGSSVTTGLSPKEKINSAFDVLLQIAFLKEAEDYAQEIPLCDLYIAQPLEKFSMGSFNSSGDLIESGVEEGRSWYPLFKKLKDSLDNIYGPDSFRTNRLPKAESINIADYQIKGLNKTSKVFVAHAMGLETKKTYTEAELSEMIRKVFGTRYYSSINYSIDRLTDSTSNLVINVKENPPTYIKLGLHYNNFSGIGLIGNLTTRDFFFRYSRSLVSANVGENLRLRAEHLQYFGLRKNIALIPNLQFESVKVDNYESFNKTGQYRQLYYNGEIKAQYIAQRNFATGIGTRYEWVRFKPTLQSTLEARGKNDFFTSFAYATLNTLDKRIYPRRGVKIYAEAGSIYNQRPSIVYYVNGNPLPNADSLGISYGNYQQLILNAETYTPISPKFTFYSLFQTGINFNYNQSLVNNFQIGGLTKTIRNQVLFAGLNETTIKSPSVAALMLGLNYNFSRNMLLMFKTNALVNNFISPEKEFRFDNWLTGYALTFAYNTPIGPLEFSAAYSDESRKVLSFVNFGIAF